MAFFVGGGEKILESHQAQRKLSNTKKSLIFKIIKEMVICGIFLLQCVKYRWQPASAI
jgi:hypothetical protein